jgi:hypothetical protein
MLLHHADEEGRVEGEALLAELMSTSWFYGRAWYTKFQRGATNYELARSALAAGDENAARHHFRVAARLYGRGIRARPRVRFLWRDGPRIRVVKTFERSPIMYANAKDAHNGAGHRLRTRWYEWRFQRLRRHMLNREEETGSQPVTGMLPTRISTGRSSGAGTNQKWLPEPCGRLWRVSAEVTTRRRAATGEALQRSIGLRPMRRLRFRSVSRAYRQRLATAAGAWRSGRGADRPSDRHRTAKGGRSALGSGSA